MTLFMLLLGAFAMLRQRHTGQNELRIGVPIANRNRGETEGLIGFSGLSAICDGDRPELKFEPYTPRYPERMLEHDGDIFAAIREKDIVVQHPYESFEVVIDFLRQAARDPDVVAIKQTPYRAGKQSAITSALIYAAEHGKSVTSVVQFNSRSLA